MRIGIRGSGVDLSLFAARVALDTQKRALVRGCDPFKRRQDTPMAVLPSSVAERQDELNRAPMAFDDIDGRVDSPAARAMNAKLDAMAKDEQAAFDDAVGRWSGYAHGTAVADIALAGMTMPKSSSPEWNGSTGRLPFPAKIASSRTARRPPSATD